MSRCDWLRSLLSLAHEPTRRHDRPRRGDRRSHARARVAPAHRDARRTAVPHPGGPLPGSPGAGPDVPLRSKRAAW